MKPVESFSKSPIKGLNYCGWIETLSYYFIDLISWPCVCWREREGEEDSVPAASLLLCCWGDGSLIQRGAFKASEIALRSMADIISVLWDGESGEKPPSGEYLCLPSLWLSWCFLLNSGWCPSAAAGRSCSVWNWAFWWRSWWPAAQDRSTKGGRQGRPAMEDLTYTLFWTSECYYFYLIPEEDF